MTALWDVLPEFVGAAALIGTTTLVGQIVGGFRSADRDRNLAKITIDNGEELFTITADDPEQMERILEELAGERRPHQPVSQDASADSTDSGPSDPTDAAATAGRPPGSANPPRTTDVPAQKPAPTPATQSNSARRVEVVRCGQCEHHNDLDRRFCAKCGSTLELAVSSAAAPDGRHESFLAKHGGAVLGALIGLTGVLLVAFLDYRDQPEPDCIAYANALVDMRPLLSPEAVEELFGDAGAYNFGSPESSCGDPKTFLTGIER